ncbi:unnamed protein product [Toxocara canis]|uniref:Uncharacterized protein n=1 Tax=Toxocara canis TaxID=6265 RepID=A0A183U9G5_TOXCA|nr:unnamed protein product [Toxocara canis]
MCHLDETWISVKLEAGASLADFAYMQNATVHIIHFLIVRACSEDGSSNRNIACLQKRCFWQKARRGHLWHAANGRSGAACASHRWLWRPRQIPAL